MNLRIIGLRGFIMSGTGMFGFIGFWFIILGFGLIFIGIGGFIKVE